MPVVQTLAQGLARQPGMAVAVASAHVGIRPNHETDGAITVYRLPVPRYPRARWHRPLRRALVAMADAWQPDLIHAHGTGYYAAAALDAGRPHLITVHGIVSREAALSPWWPLKPKLAWQYDALVEAIVLRRAQHVVAINPYVRRAFARYAGLRWYDIPNPVDEAFFGLVRRPEPGFFLCPARVIPRKGIDTLIAALALLVRRHPHVFGDLQVADAEEVLRNWDSIKQRERGGTPDSILAGVPRAMAALLRAYEVSKRAARVGFEWPDLESVFDKLHEEETELRAAIAAGDAQEIEAEVGDVLFTVVNVARWAGADPENALRRMLDRFTARFQEMEKRAGKPLVELSAEEWDELWNQSKRDLAHGG
jgi:glycosyltransferase involved in cell wall biosynthesis